MNLITIITPIYRGEKYLEKLYTMIEKNCIRLIEKYPQAKVEYIIVNDSPEILLRESKQNKHYKLRIVCNEKNVGIHQSRVNAILNSESEYIFMLDQDDEIDERFLVSQYSKIGTRDVIVANGYRKFMDKNKLLYRTVTVQKLISNEKMYLYGTDMILSPGQCLIRRSSIPESWYKNILRANGCDDFALWLLMFEQKKQFIINKERLYYHIENDENYSSSTNNMTMSYMEMCQIFAKGNLIHSNKIKLLIQRYQFKIFMKNNKYNPIKKIWQIIKNRNIVFYILIYKILGYH